MKIRNPKSEIQVWSLGFGIWSFCGACWDLRASDSLGALDRIPPLRPPRAEIPPTLWEKNGTWIMVSAVLLLIVIGLIWYFRYKKKWF